MNPGSAQAHLLDDFARLAALERAQDQHRRELQRREEHLHDRRLACEELETVLAARWDLLVRQALLIERAASSLRPDVEAAELSLVRGSLTSGRPSSGIVPALGEPA